MIETVETNKPDEQDGTNDRLYTEVKRLKVLIADDGTTIPFNPNMKIVYAYLYTFQTNEGRRNYPEPIHPNMDLIAWENGITKPTAQKAVDDLMRAGVLIKDQIQVGSGFKSNNYVVLKPSKVVARGVTPPHPNEVKSKPKKKAAKPKIEESENGVQQQEHEQQSPDVASAPATNDSEQQPGIQQPAGDSGNDVSANDAVNQITIFDEDGVVTEEFISSLTGDAAPKRNTDSTLQSFRYVYWVARYSQDERDGIPVRTREEYMEEARPEHIPTHLLPKEHRSKPKPEPVEDFDDSIPF